MIALVCHDAGGAEILSSYVRQTALDCLYVLEGPARKIFERKLGNIETTSLSEAVRQSTSVLCGTSWQSDIEIDAIKLARSLGKQSIAFIDHWVNYRERFTRSGIICLPDELWVGDRMAETMAKEIFPGLPVTWVNNPYLLDIQQELAAIDVRNLSAEDSISVLYVCEPIGEHALLQHGNAYFWGYVEEDALRYFLANCSVLGKPIKRILIRPHPAEKSGKYNWAQNEFDLSIEMGGDHSLLEEIVNSDVVVGCASMAMVVALLAGKKVVSCIPTGGKFFNLPHPEIISIQSMLEK